MKKWEMGVLKPGSERMQERVPGESGSSGCMRCLSPVCERTSGTAAADSNRAESPSALFVSVQPDHYRHCRLLQLSTLRDKTQAEVQNPPAALWHQPLLLLGVGEEGAVKMAQLDVEGDGVCG